MDPFTTTIKYIFILNSCFTECKEPLQKRAAFHPIFRFITVKCHTDLFIEGLSAAIIRLPLLKCTWYCCKSRCGRKNLHAHVFFACTVKPDTFTFLSKASTLCYAASARPFSLFRRRSDDSPTLCWCCSCEGLVRFRFVAKYLHHKDWGGNSR